MPSAAPSKIIQSAHLSDDTGRSSDDFITNSADQTIHGTLSDTLDEGESVQVSYDGGLNWRNASYFALGDDSWNDTTTLTGSDTFEARVTDASGSSAAFVHSYQVDTTPPEQVALSDTHIATAAATTGAAVATLSSTDVSTVTYALYDRDDAESADDQAFTITGDKLRIGDTPLAAGTYHIDVAATDAAGNLTIAPESITVQDAPNVTSIVRAGGAAGLLPASTASADYAVSFDESVTGVDPGDFTLTSAGTATGSISRVTGSGSTYAVTVDGLSGDGTLRLDLKGSGTGIVDGAGIGISGGYTAGAAYTLDHTAPARPIIAGLTVGSDSGPSGSDGITGVTTPTVVGIAEANSVVNLYDSDGTTVLGTETAGPSGNWMIASSSLSDGIHNLTATATDSAGNASAASPAIAVTIDTAPPADLTLSTTAVATADAIHGSSIASLSSRDITSVTYSLVGGDGLDDADNNRFTIIGDDIRIGASDLASGRYHILLQDTDAAGNSAQTAEVITVGDPPSVAAITRSGGASGQLPPSATSASFTVTFDENVTGVDAGDFTLTSTGTAAGSISRLAGSGSTYAVTVDGLSGDGTLRLDLKGTGTGIVDGAGLGLSGGYIAGATYTLDHTVPTQPAIAGPAGPALTPTPGPDLLVVPAAGGTVVGLGGDDTIAGGSGNDLLLGNEGDDVITDGDGQNTVFGGMGDDRITVGNGGDLLFGGEGGDTIQAGNGDNIIVGGTGNGASDSLDGSDSIVSGSGDDLILGNGGNDTVGAGAGYDTVAAGFGNDVVLGQQGDDFILGNQGDDTLVGGLGGDTLVGGQGDDVLYGSQGDDVLYGNEGLNTFVFDPGDTDFKSGLGTGDTIMDFATGTSRIDFASGPAGTASNFGSASTTAKDFAAAQALAQTLIDAGDAYAFVSNGMDGYLFTTGGAGTTITDAVKLAGAGAVGAVKYTDIADGALA